MNSTPDDALDQLTADHAHVKELFDQFAATASRGLAADSQSLVATIVDELHVHEAVENEVFFPAVQEVLRKDKVLEDAGLEQEDAGGAIKALSELAPGDAGYADKVAQLGAQIAAHAAEEEKDVFPKVHASAINTTELGERMAAYKSELTDPAGGLSGDDLQDRAV